MAITTYLSNKLLDHQTGKAAFALPTVYVALSTTAPTISGTGVTEPSGGAYARVATNAATWNTASAGSTSNASAINFPAATADWAAGANFTYGLMYDAATGGNLLGYGVLVTPKNALNGDTISISAGQLTITLS